MIRILIADDHAIVRHGLQQIVAEEPDLVVAGEAQDAQQTLELIRTQQWQVVILDISMPGRSGIDVLKEITQQNPGLPVLILSMHPEEQFAVRAFKAGASGYLTKESAPDELVAAIHKVVAGGKYVSPSLAERLVSGLGNSGVDSVPPHEFLSDREYEVLRLIGSGKTVSEIAEQLALSVKTVSTYRVRILGKLHLRNNAEIMHYAIRHSVVV